MEKSTKVQEFFIHLALNHQVLPEESDGTCLFSFLGKYPLDLLNSYDLVFPFGVCSYLILFTSIAVPSLLLKVLVFPNKEVTVKSF